MNGTTRRGGKRPAPIGAAILALSLALVALAACGAGKKQAGQGGPKPVVAVSILPQRYFVERLGGDRVDTLVLVGPGQSPHSFEPTPRQMLALSAADAWILSGTDFEIGLKPKIAAQYPSLPIVDGTAGVKFRQLQEGEEEDDDAHAGESGADHQDSNIDRHTWLGSRSAKILALHIRDALSAIDPAGAEIYEANYASLVADIDETYGNLSASLAGLRGRTVLVFHPSFGYFLDDFGIRQEAVETGGKEPTAKTLAALIERAKAARTPAIFVQAQFPVNAAFNVAEEVGAEVVPLDPLAPDWLANIVRMGDALKRALDAQTGPDAGSSSDTTAGAQSGTK